MAADPRIGTKIRRARERKRMRQQDVADALGVSRTTYDSWENDRAYPRSSIGALEEVLGISLTSDDEIRIISPRARKVLSQELGEEDYRRVIGLLEGTLTWPEPAADPGEAPAGEAEADQQPAG